MEAKEANSDLAFNVYLAVSKSIEAMKSVLDDIQPDTDCTSLNAELHFLKKQIQTLFEQSTHYTKLLGKVLVDKEQVSISH